MAHNLRLLRLAVLALFLLTINSSCARTKMVTQINREYATRTFRSILVATPMWDMGLQAHFEDKICDKLTAKGVQSFADHEIIFRGKDYSEDEILAIWDSLGIDAVIIVTPEDYGTTETYVPPSSETKVDANVQDNGNGRYRITGKAKTQTSGGYYIDKPWGLFTVEVLDAKTGETVLVGTAKTKGNAFANTKTLHGSLASKIVALLKRDGFI
jgi:hypothetical protein